MNPQLQTRADDRTRADLQEDLTTSELIEIAQQLGDVLDLAGAGLAVLDPQGQCLSRNATAARLPRSHRWLASVRREEPVAGNPAELARDLAAATRQIYDRIAPRLDATSVSPRLGEGPFRLIALHTPREGASPLTALIFTSSSTMPAVEILLRRIIGMS